MLRHTSQQRQRPDDEAIGKQSSKQTFSQFNHDAKFSNNDKTDSIDDGSQPNTELMQKGIDKKGTRIRSTPGKLKKHRVA